jgi:hypothetical protein
MKVYVASSWRNGERQQAVVRALRAAGHEVYDFRNPEPGNHGFSWSLIDPNWRQWSPEQFREVLKHPIAVRGFGLDMAALEACEACVLVAPCGRSAHLELGYAVGARKRTVVLLAEGEPELMLAMADRLCLTIPEVVEALSEATQEWRAPVGSAPSMGGDVPSTRGDSPSTRADGGAQSPEGRGAGTPAATGAHSEGDQPVRQLNLLRALRELLAATEPFHSVGQEARKRGRGMHALEVEAGEIDALKEARVRATLAVDRATQEGGAR